MTTVSKLQEKNVGMAWISFACILVLSFAWSLGKPLTADDLTDFEFAIGNGKSYTISKKELSQESKRIRDVITMEKRKLSFANDDNEYKGEKRDSDSKKSGQKLHSTKGNPYGPEIPQRTKGNSLTDVIERVNKGLQRNLKEGDIAVSNSNDKRVVTKYSSLKWLNGVVPYVLASGFPYTDSVNQAIARLEEVTCIRFKPRSTETDFVSVKQLDGCWSYVGRQGGEQEVSIGSGCDSRATVIHEFMHALGFSHEQNRPDRDLYVTINLGNIDSDNAHNFDKQNEGDVVYKSTGYDYKSIMHYGSYDFSINDEKTIQANDDPNMFLGGDLLTEKDIADLNEAYSCTATPINGGWTQWSAYSACSTSCGPGTKTKTRSCTLPSPANGGSDCSGSSTEATSCDLGSCSGPVIQDSFNCNFEDDMCGWQSIEGVSPNSIYFERHKGETSSIGTGPKKDATGNTEGYYVYLETSFVPNNVYGRMISPVLEPGTDGKRCAEYKVHMYGEGMGSLKVIALDMDTNTETVLRVHNGNHHKKYWFANSVTFDASTPTKIIFEGMRKHSWQSDMAIDEVSIHGAQCTGSAYDCDFEASLCSWTPSRSQYYPFELGTDDTPSSQVTGPLSASTGKGYLFADGWSHNSWYGDQSTLTSPLIEISSNGKICLSFDYHMDNYLDPDDPAASDIGTLTVKTKSFSSGMNTVWSHSDIEGINWSHADVTIDSTEAQKIQFHVFRGASKKGDIGIDNVKLTMNACLIA